MAVVTLPLRDPYRGWPLFSQGLRPFFLGASLWACVAMLLWIAQLLAPWSPGFALPALDWHRHELVFGFVSAVVAGFLLTAGANWAHRPPLRGVGLASLWLCWLLARGVLLLPPLNDLGVVQFGLALLFPLALLVFVTRELILGGNYRNLSVMAILALYVAADALSLSGLVPGLLPGGLGPGGVGSGASPAPVGYRLGIAALLMLVMLIGGRVVPAFTRSWLARQKDDAQSLPVAFNRFDAGVMGVSVLALLAWALLPPSMPGGALLLLAGALNIVRAARWRGLAALSEPLVVVLHAGFLLVAIGFLAAGLSMLPEGGISASFALHVWTVGAITTMCFAMMTRASLGHTGQALYADGYVRAIYVVLLLSLVARLLAGAGVAYRLDLLLSASCWCVAHGLFVWRFWRHFTGH